MVRWREKISLPTSSSFIWSLSTAKGINTHQHIPHSSAHSLRNPKPNRHVISTNQNLTMRSPKLPDAVASAIASGDFAQFQSLYQLNPDIPLREIAKHAAKQGQAQVMQWCCDQGWRPPRESEACGDALACAVMCNKYEFAKWLLDHGHRPTPEDPMHGPSSISWTMYEDTANQEMLKLLLDYGHDLEHSGAGVAAAEYGNLEALRLLLDRGVNIEDAEMSWYPFNEDGDEPYESQGVAMKTSCSSWRTADGQTRSSSISSNDCSSFSESTGHILAAASPCQANCQQQPFQATGKLQCEFCIARTHRYRYIYTF